ncbi:hypothetical protein WN944_000887 [Citrus x changshan-huyou]|uniref:Uncharacterized protein n=1 Tax=Citrus x changshan-huyou TaxID=2935761 RepID=A0AAP0MDQ3_9ROSI
MGSRDKDQTAAHHQPLLSSLVVRPSVSDGAGDGGRGGAGSDYEPGEVRREPPSYYRSDRYPDDPGSIINAGGWWHYVFQIAVVHCVMEHDYISCGVAQLKVLE